MRNDLKFTTAQFLAQNSFFWLRNHFFKFQVGGVGRNLSFATHEVQKRFWQSLQQLNKSNISLNTLISKVKQRAKVAA